MSSGIVNKRLTTERYVILLYFKPNSNPRGNMNTIKRFASNNLLKVLDDSWKNIYWRESTQNILNNHPSCQIKLRWLFLNSGNNLRNNYHQGINYSVLIILLVVQALLIHYETHRPSWLSSKSTLADEHLRLIAPTVSTCLTLS